MFRLTSGSVMSRFGGDGGPRGLLRRADSLLSKELTLVRSSEIALSSFTFGVLQGRFKAQGGLTLILPIDLVSAGVFHALALFPFAKSYAHHLRAFGDGALGSFMTTIGYGVGERWSTGGSLIKGMSGVFGDAKEPAGGSTIADKELAGLVRAGV